MNLQSETYKYNLFTEALVVFAGLILDFRWNEL